MANHLGHAWGTDHIIVDQVNGRTLAWCQRYECYVLSEDMDPFRVVELSHEDLDRFARAVARLPR